MIRFSRCTALLCAASLLAFMPVGALAERASTTVASPRQTYDFDQGWKMKTGDDTAASAAVYDDATWQAVTLPHAFNEQEAFARDIHTLSTGITWYRKHFKLPKGAPSHAFLEFEGVRMAADVWVNGTKVGLSENGVMAFGFDITRALKPGDNVVSVRVDSDWKYKERATSQAYQWSDMNFYANYGGINKPVRLHLTGDVYQTLPLYSNLGTTGAYIWADGFDIAGKAATIHAETQTRNDGTAPRTVSYSVVVRDLSGKTVATFAGDTATLKPGETRTLTATQRLNGLNFWSWGYGYLYTVTTVLKDGDTVIDAVDTKTGFRKTDFEHGMFSLNDRVLHLKGYAQRTTDEWPAVATSVPPWISDFTDGLVTKSNGNLVRWMHVTPSKQQIESADRLGLITNMPAGDSEGDPTGRRFDQRVELMRDALIYNRNDPSIVFIESGNKGISEDHMKLMLAVRDQYDPHGGRAIGSREMLDSGTAEYGGEMLYVNKSAGKPLWAHEYSRDEAARAYQDDFTPPFHKDSPDYNRNVETMAVEDVKRWWDYYEQRPGSGGRVSAGGVKIGYTDSNSHFRGDNNYRRSGVLDAVRLPKDPWFVHQVMWDGWVNSEVPHTYIIGHWNYAPGVVKPVYVASNGDSVELFLNGKSLGKGEKSAGFLFTFKDIAFAPGELKAVATYADGRHSDFALKTAGAPAAIRLTPHYGPRGLVADGNDLMLVDVEVVDKDGQRVPTAFNKITFKLDGAAVWKGGIAQGDSSGKPRPAAATMAQGSAGATPTAGTAHDEDNYVGATTLPVELGVNRVLIRATTTAGRVHLTATADGLKPAALDATSTGIAVRDGLSSTFAEDYQTSDLSRGPTPSGPSYTQWRQGFTPVAITAGSNAADAHLSHDDNERTTWTSDGTQAGAWIDYDLGHAVVLNGLSLKLTGWRLRAYPIKVTVDDKVVYDGVTPKSLGYVALDFAPVTGRHVRITQTGLSADRDAFGNIVELKNNKEAQSVGADSVAAGWKLSLVETDILGPK